MFDKKATEGLNKYVPFTKNRENWSNQRPHSKRNDIQRRPIHKRLGYKATFVPPNKAPVNQWFHGQQNLPNQRFVEKGSSSNNRPKNAQEAKYAYKSNYMGKNPMTRTQWRRHQRQKKWALQAIPNSGDNKNKQVVEIAKRPIKERISAPNVAATKEKCVEAGHMEADDFLDSEPDLDILVNVVSILPAEYDVWSEVTDGEDEFDNNELALHRPMCYYVLNNGCLEEQMATFEKPDEGMKSHLKPLFIQAKVNDVGVNKVLIDGGAAVNLMPEFLLHKIGKRLSDLHTHNIVLSNYEGETGFSL
ncbi:hypothetical protein A2U01_0025060, partial [Trifolium medium]|nr:hypothetical protein [Trifolium medium]